MTEEKKEEKKEIPDATKTGMSRMLDSVGRALEREEVQDRLVNAGVTVLEKQLGLTGRQEKKKHKTKVQLFGESLTSWLPFIIVMFILAVLWRIITHYVP